MGSVFTEREWRDEATAAPAPSMRPHGNVLERRRRIHTHSVPPPLFVVSFATGVRNESENALRNRPPAPAAGRDEFGGIGREERARGGKEGKEGGCVAK